MTDNNNKSEEKEHSQCEEWKAQILKHSSILILRVQLISRQCDQVHAGVAEEDQVPL